MSGRSSRQIVQHAASLGDRARRSQRAVSHLARLLPLTAGVALLAAVIVAFTRGPVVLVAIVLAIGAAAAAFMFFDARRSRVITDEDAAVVDCAAGLDGALRSAYWFSAGPTTETASERDAVWRAFHIDNAAAHCEDVNWAAVYGERPRRRVWVVSLAGIVAALVLSFATFRLPGDGSSPSPSPSTSADARSAGESTGPVSPALVPQLIEGVLAMQAGRAPSPEALSAIGQVLELAKHNPAAREQIAGLLAGLDGATSGARDWSAPMQEGLERWAEEELYGFDPTSSRLEWAYQEAMARVALEQSAKPDASAAPDAPADAPSDGQPGDPNETGGDGAGKTDGTVVLADMGGAPTSFSQLLFGRQQASDGPARANAPQSAARQAALSAALRTEVVHAKADIAVPNTEPSGTRRATNAAGSAGTPLDAGALTYDRARTAQPPAIPDARRPLVHDYFRREADPERPRQP